MAKRRKNAHPDKTADDSDEFPEYASPPCYRHEIDPSYFGEPAEQAGAESSDTDTESEA